MFKEENRARSPMISFDDKAYIRPGSEVGARNVKKGVIYDVSDPSKQKALPQHDFTEAKVHQTPSSFRFIRGKVATIDGEQKFIHEDDQTIVTVRPKSYIGSSESNGPLINLRLNGKFLMFLNNLQYHHQSSHCL